MAINRLRVATRKAPQSRNVGGRPVTAKRVGCPPDAFRGRVIETILLEECAPKRDVRRPDLVEVVDTAVEEAQRVARVLLGMVDIARAQVHGSKRSERACSLRVVARLECDAERVLEMGDRLFGLPEEEVERAERVLDSAEVRAVGELLVVR